MQYTIDLKEKYL